MKKSGARKRPGKGKRPESRTMAFGRGAIGHGASRSAPDGNAVLADLTPPRHLSPEAAEWWRRTIAEYEFVPGDPGLLLLCSALEAFDRMREAQRELAQDGITIRDRFGQVKQHPATMVERDARMAMARLIRQLGLDLEPLQLPGRPGGR